MKSLAEAPAGSDTEQVGQEVQEVQHEDAALDEGHSESGSNESESLAEGMGWVPKDEYRGDPEKWVDAETFIGRRNVLKERNEHLIKEIQTLKNEFAKHKEVTEQFKKFQTEQQERKAAEYKAQIAELRMQKSEAIRNGDGDAVNDIDDRIDTLKERSKEAVAQPAAAQQPNAPHPDFGAWQAENSWFTNDRKMKAYATELAIELREKGDTSEGRVFFDKVKELVRKDFPNKFGNPNRSKPGSVETGSTVSFRGKTLNDIPEGERNQIKRFIEQKLYTEADAVKEYFS